MRSLWCLTTLLAGCAPPLSQWCVEQNEEGCLEMRVRDESGELRQPLVGCGTTDRWSVSDGFSGEDYHFSHRTGELVAVREWTDTDIEGHWYGRVASCQSPCAYGEHENLVSCEDDPPD
jgi:hypothetical protein